MVKWAGCISLGSRPHTINFLYTCKARSTGLYLTSCYALVLHPKFIAYSCFKQTPGESALSQECAVQVPVGVQVSCLIQPPGAFVLQGPLLLRFPFLLFSASPTALYIIYPSSLLQSSPRCIVIRASKGRGDANQLCLKIQ